MTAAATAGLDRVLTILARFRLPHAIVLLALVAMLHGPMARGQEAASEPARLRTDAIEALVVRVALYPDPLLALVLQGSTLPVQVVQAARFLERRTRDAKLQPDPGWDTSVTGLLNYPTVLAMMNEDLDWTEALGTAVVDQLPDVQAAVQQVRSELQAAGTLVSNDRQTVVTDENTIRIEPAKPDVIYVPIYEPVPQPAAPAAMAEPAPPAAAPVPAPVEAVQAAPPVAYAAPAPAAYPAAVPTTYAVPQVTYSDPYASFWTHGAAFAGGAVVGGMLGYALNDDDDDDDDDIELDFDEDVDWDDVDWDEVDRGNIESNRERNRSRDVNIEDSNVIIGGNRSRTERQTQLAQSQLRANQQRKGSVSSRQGSQARARVARQPAAARGTGAGTRAAAPATRQGQSRQRVTQQQGTAAKSSAFDAKPRQEVRREASRGSRSRASAQTTGSNRPQAAQRQSASRPAAAAPRQTASRTQSAQSRPNAFAGQSRNVQRESARGFQSRGGGGSRGGGRGR